jgi:hypothetical protein
MRWIVSPRFDLAWFIGGAATGYGMLALHAVFALDMMIVWFAWFVLLDSPHFFATWSRTYLDREEWRTRGRLLLNSLSWFLVPPLVLLLSFAHYRLQVPQYEAALVMLSAAVNLWAYWHVIRQHYGFMALYQRRNEDCRPIDRRIDAAFLYGTLLAPFAAFVVRHPETRAALGMMPGASQPARAIVALSVVIVAVVTFVFVCRQVARRRQAVAPNVPKLLFLLAVVPLHLVICYSTAVLTAPVLAFAAFVTIFHDIQYHAVVWFYQRNRYRGSDGGRYGPAAWVGRSFATFALCAVAAGVFMGGLVCGLDVQPGCTPLVPSGEMTLFGDVTWREALFAIFLGFLMHHYFIDQFIWRPGRDEVLRRDLRLATA